MIIINIETACKSDYYVTSTTLLNDDDTAACLVSQNKIMCIKSSILFFFKFAISISNRNE